MKKTACLLVLVMIIASGCLNFSQANSVPDENPLIKP